MAPERRAAVSSILLKLAAMGVAHPGGAGDEGCCISRVTSSPATASNPAPLRALCPATSAFMDTRRPAGRDEHAPPCQAAEARPHPRPLRLARELSLPIDAAAWHNVWCRATGSTTGCCTTPSRSPHPGVFHVAEGGLPIPADKLRVPLPTYLRLLEEALRPPAGSLGCRSRPAGPSRWRRWSPAAPAAVLSGGAQDLPEKRDGGALLRSRRTVLQPGLRGEHLRQRRRSLSPPARSALDVDGWTGHSGCVILAPHSRGCARRLGLPHASRAPGRARGRHVLETEAELYNNGSPSRSPHAASTA